MKQVSFVEFRKNLSQYIGLARFADERITVTHHGKVVGGFVSAEALQFLEEMEMKQDCSDYDRAMRRHKKNKSRTISHIEMMKRLDLDVPD